MKNILLTAFLTTAGFLSFAFSQEEPPTQLTPTIVTAQVATDSDGDLVPDGIDPNPLLPDVPAFSWWVSDVTVGWDLDQSQIDKLEQTAGDETITQRKTSFTVGGGLSVGSGATHGINSDPTAIFLSLLPGGNLLKKAGDDFQSQSHLAVSFDLKKSLDRVETVKECRSEFQKLEKQRAIKNRHIEFTVEFFNDTDDAYHFSNYSIPVQTSNRQTRAEALCFVAGEMKQEFEVPANRPSGYPVRFRAMLSTTQSEQILDALESGDLRLAIDRSNGRAVNLTNQVDEIAERQQISTQVEALTSKIEFRTEENATSWRVAKFNPLTGQPTTLREAINAVNQMVASPQEPDYIEASGGVIYAVGSFRNTPQNAFEVTNAPNAPLKILGWTRMNQYGVVQNGKWAHELDKPVGEGAIFSFLPYVITREELARQIYTCDPPLRSEWLALCHFWLHYDERKRFAEYPLSITSYPMVPFFADLEPDFAKADFDSTISLWISRNANLDSTETRQERSIESQDFRNKVRHHRKAILDAAFDGYSEAGALLSRLAIGERDEIEARAIQTSILIGNSDAAAVESCNRLYNDLNRGKIEDIESVDVPDHIFSKNLYGFLRFGQCERGHRSGRARDSALAAFSYSADLGNSFGQAMKGWILLNTAYQKRRKLINGPDWDSDRDIGIALLNQSLDRSILSKYVLADTYYNNRIGIPKDADLAKTYLQFAAAQNFGNAGKMLAERYGN
ncbi:MAG: hypothetical protein P1U89_03845 [Verrucomicrobiales bacterium]|nr:hypothetical protein [Verrucomicrobiales bacterium]